MRVHRYARVFLNETIGGSLKVLVTGGCGYKGSVLVPKLLKKHDVTVVDTMWFGSALEEHPNLSIREGDIRNPVDCTGFDAIIHLAGIANDPCGELDARLTWEVNVLATMRLAESAVDAGVKQFIFASSASVYGIKDNEAVNEDSPLAPVSDYNKTKQVAERVLKSYGGFYLKIVRPATVCGVSPRMRLDVVVNMLTAQALEKGEITVHCGSHGAELMRPHVHIEDITDLYCWLLERPGDCVFNAGFDNQSIGTTGKLINERIPSKMYVSQVMDKRSYCVDSSRLLREFTPKRGVKDAIEDIVIAWGEGRIKPGPKTMNLQWMKSQGLVAQ